VDEDYYNAIQKAELVDKEEQLFVTSEQAKEKLGQVREGLKGLRDKIRESKRRVLLKRLES